MELNAEAKPGKTGDEAGTPAAAAAAAACRGATDATEAAAVGASPMKDDSTGLPAPGPPDTPSPGNPPAPGPGVRPGNIEGPDVSPRPKGAAADGAALGARPGYIVVGGWVEIFVEGGIVGKDDGSVEGEIEELRERN